MELEARLLLENVKIVNFDVMDAPYGSGGCGSGCKNKCEDSQNLTFLSTLTLQLPYGAGDCKDGQRLTLPLPSRHCVYSSMSKL